MSVVWLQSIGFVTAFSAIFAKSWRLNKIFGEGERYRRIQVMPRDVVLPFVFLLSMNVIILIVWTVLSPLRWKRAGAANYDVFGRSRESYGRCISEDQFIGRICGTSILIVDLIAVIVANYQSYMARSVPIAFQESFYIFICNALILESLLLGVPVLLVVRNDPSASYFVEIMLVIVISMNLILTIFIPKYNKQRIWIARNAAGQSRSVVTRRNSGGSVNPGQRRNFLCTASSARPVLVDTDPGLRESGRRAIRRNTDFRFQSDASLTKFTLRKSSNRSQKDKSANKMDGLNRLPA